MIPLNVSGPFHTAILAPASEKLATELNNIQFSERFNFQSLATQQPK